MTKSAYRFLFCLTLGLYGLLVSCSPYITTETPAPAEAQETRVFSPSPTPSLVPSATLEPTCKVVTGVPDGYLNLRAGKGTSFAIVDVLNEGTILTVIAKGSWMEVEDARGNHGYINSRYCK